jgi:glycosyltransferase involved in cell wall biosynthesis
MLRAAGLNFEWDVVGPSGRVEGYYDGVFSAVQDDRLEDYVRIKPAVSAQELADLYDEAHLYIQPSIEEGFCITALDAAAAGLPVIASPAGALEQIARVSGGLVVESDTSKLFKAIIDFVQGDCWGDSEEIAKNVRTQFSWDTAATALCARYNELLKTEENSDE